MSDDFTSVEIPEVEDHAPSNGQSSTLDRLRKRREHLRGHRTTKIEIPGYGGDLLAEYQPVEGGSGLLRVALAAAGEADGDAIEDATTGIAKMCVQLFARDNGELVPLNELYGLGAAPVKYDEQLAKVFGFEADTASDVIREMFPSDDAIQAHAIQLVGFVQGIDSSVDEELLGEA